MEQFRYAPVNIVLASMLLVAHPQADNAEVQKTAEEQLALEAAVKQKTRARKEHNVAVAKAEKDVARRAAEVEKKVHAAITEASEYQTY